MGMFGISIKYCDYRANSKILFFYPHQATKSQISKVFSSMLAIHSDKPGKNNTAFKCCVTHIYNLRCAKTNKQKTIN